jgi:hypothetical protein
MKRKLILPIWAMASSAIFAADVPVTGDITVNTTWTANNTYIMSKPIFVTGNAVLTIEPGTLILGDEDEVAETFGSLVITRGSQLIAEGTADEPIVFTAREERDGIDGVLANKPDPAAGNASYWGGVVMLGNAQVNNYVGGVNQGTARIEGFPVEAETTNTTYGGGLTPNNADNSGILKYVSIRFGGFEFAPNNEINGLTLGGVGSGTTIEFVEVVSNSDDGVEFFGGTVNTKHIAVAFCHDESFDIDQGYSGYNQFWFAIQNSNPTLGDYGGEWDGGFGSTVTAGPETLTHVYNMTMIGTGSTAVGSIDDGIQLSDAFAGTLANSVIHDFNGVAMSNVGDGVESPKPVFNNNTWGTFAGGAGIVTSIGGVNATDPAGTGNSAVGTDPQLVGISRTPNGGLDPRPNLGSPLYTSELSDFPAGAPVGFFTTTNYRGAFGGSNWLTGWTYLSQKGYLSGLPDVDTSGSGSSLTDADGDGISDAVESENGALGFDPNLNDASSVLASLKTTAQFEANFTAGQTSVTSNPNAFSLYTLSNIQDLSVSDLIIQKSGSDVNVTIPVESSVDLVPPFTAVGNATLLIEDVPTDKQFYRIRLAPDAE